MYVLKKSIILEHFQSVVQNTHTFEYFYYWIKLDFYLYLKVNEDIFSLDIIYFILHYQFSK